MNPRLVLIDTSVWILSSGRASQPRVKQRVRELLTENRVATMPLVKLELLGGTRTDAEFERLKSRLDALHRIPLGEQEWEEASRLTFRLKKQGKTVPYAEILIATAAIQSGALLVHADQH